MSFTNDLTQNNISSGGSDSSYCLQAPICLSKIKKWSGRLDHFPKGIGNKIQDFMAELEHDDVIALFSVLLKGVHEWECHWQALMPIWKLSSKWEDKLDEHGWSLFDQKTTNEVTYFFREEDAQLLLSVGLISSYFPSPSDGDVETTVEHDWDTFSQWYHGFNLAHKGKLVFVKPVGHHNPYWCPHAAPDKGKDKPKSNPRP